MSGFVLGWLRKGTLDLAMLYNVSDEKGLKLHHALTEESHAATLIATDTEVAIAMAARSSVAKEGIAVAVVSAPSLELFAQQDTRYRNEVLADGLCIGIEVAGGFAGIAGSVSMEFSSVWADLGQVRRPKHFTNILESRKLRSW
jgi:transketolase